MASWPRITASLPSRMNISTKRDSRASDGRMHLMASSVPSGALFLVRARYTSAIPPRAISPSSMYFPNGTGFCGDPLGRRSDIASLTLSCFSRSRRSPLVDLDGLARDHIDVDFLFLGAVVGPELEVVLALGECDLVPQPLILAVDAHACPRRQLGSNEAEAEQLGGVLSRRHVGARVPLQMVRLRAIEGHVIASGRQLEALERSALADGAPVDLDPARKGRFQIEPAQRRPACAQILAHQVRNWSVWFDLQILGQEFDLLLGLPDLSVQAAQDPVRARQIRIQKRAGLEQQDGLGQLLLLEQLLAVCERALGLVGGGSGLEHRVDKWIELRGRHLLEPGELRLRLGSPRVALGCALEELSVGFDRLVELAGQLVGVGQREQHVRVLARERGRAAQKADRAPVVVLLFGFERGFAEPIPGVRLGVREGRPEKRSGRRQPTNFPHVLPVPASTTAWDILDLFNYITKIISSPRKPMIRFFKAEC